MPRTPRAARANAADGLKAKDGVQHDGAPHEEDGAPGTNAVMPAEGGVQLADDSVRLAVNGVGDGAPGTEDGTPGTEDGVPGTDTVMHEDGNAPGTDAVMHEDDGAQFADTNNGADGLSSDDEAVDEDGADGAAQGPGNIVPTTGNPPRGYFMTRFRSGRFWCDAEDVERMESSSRWLSGRGLAVFSEAMLIRAQATTVDVVHPEVLHYIQEWEDGLARGDAAGARFSKAGVFGHIEQVRSIWFSSTRSSLCDRCSHRQWRRSGWSSPMSPSRSTGPSLRFDGRLAHSTTTTRSRPRAATQRRLSGRFEHY